MDFSYLWCSLMSYSILLNYIRLLDAVFSLYRVLKCDIILQTFPFEPLSCDIHSCCKNMTKFQIASINENEDREV